MQRLDIWVAATNGANGISSAIGNQRKGGDIESSITNSGTKGADDDKHKSTKTICEFSKTINKHIKKMVSVAKMKCELWE
jgi:hypothetical protein